MASRLHTLSPLCPVNTQDPPCRPLLQGLIPEKKIFEVNIEKGHKHNAKVVLRGEAGYSEPGIQPGDVVFVLEARPHKVFKRLASDLVMDKVGWSWVLYIRMCSVGALELCWHARSLTPSRFWEALNLVVDRLGLCRAGCWLNRCGEG